MPSAIFLQSLRVIRLITMLATLLLTIHIVRSDTVRAAPVADSSRLAFTSLRSGKSEIYVIDPEQPGVRPVRLVAGHSPAWASAGPLAGRLAYVAASGEPTRANNTSPTQVWIANGDGSNPVMLTHAKTSCESPAWAPSGQQIAVVCYDSGHGEIYVINADGSGLTQLTHDYGASPAWSPDGQYIAYVSAGEVVVMHPDGSGQRRIFIDHPKINTSGLSDLAWSPDGLHLAFSLFVGEHEAIFTANPDGLNLLRLTGSGDFNHHNPAWSPDSQRIAFGYYDTANRDIYVMNADGSDVTRLTTGYAAFEPAWTH